MTLLNYLAVVHPQDMDRISPGRVVDFFPNVRLPQIGYSLVLDLIDHATQVDFVSLGLNPDKQVFYEFLIRKSCLRRTSMGQLDISLEKPGDIYLIEVKKGDEDFNQLRNNLKKSGLLDPPFI